MHINQFTVDKRLIGMYFKYPWGSLGLKDIPFCKLEKNDVDTSENYIHFSDINLTSTWQLGELTRYKNKILSYQF